MARSHVYVRALNVNDPKEVALAEAAILDSGNDFPRGAFALPSTTIMVAVKDGEVILIQPFYRPLLLGSLAPVGSPSAADLASAQHQMTQAAFTDCHRFGLLDIEARTSTPETQRYAERHGYTPTHTNYAMEVR